MEFDQLQKIWDTQNSKPMYAINEEALHQRIVSKKYQAIHITRISEWLIMIAHSAAGLFNLWLAKGNVFLYILSVWMLISAVYVLINRIRRIQNAKRFDRSMLGDLQYAVATAAYQVRLSAIIRWNIVPVAVLIFFSFIQNSKMIWVAVAAGLFFILVFIASGWEHNIYKRRKRELDTLLQKLINND